MDGTVEKEKIISLKESVQFKEIQKFTQWWLWLIIFSPSILTGIYVVGSIVNLFSSVGSGNSGNVSMSWISCRITSVEMLFVILYLLTLLFLAFSKLKVSVSDSIKISHLLFFKKVNELTDISEAKVIDYDFVGYGIRKT